MFAIVKKGQLIAFAIILCIGISLSFCSSRVIAVSKEDGHPKSAFAVVIDAGHGGVDPGGIGIKTKVKEADLNLAVSKKLQNYLLAAGISVTMTRLDENGLYKVYTKHYKKEDMSKRKEIIKNANPNLVVSIHMNRFSNRSLRGAQAFYNKNSTEGKRLAEFVQEEFVNQLENSAKFPSVGDYYMLNCTCSASIIAECGFLSNDDDELLLSNSSYQDKVAYSIFCAIIKYLDIKN